MIRNRPLINCFILFFCLLWSCSPKVSKEMTEAEKTKMESKVQALAVEHFTSDYKIDYNASQTFACISKSFRTRKKEVFATLSLLIYDASADEIILQETIPKASAKWISDSEVEVRIVPGMLAEDSTPDPGFIFHVQEKKKKAR